MRGEEGSQELAGDLQTQNGSVLRRPVASTDESWEQQGTQSGSRGN